jgi:hypothetical protein
MRSRFVATASLSAALLPAQTNTVPGTDVHIYDVQGITVAGRRGAAFPNGEAGVIFGHAHCNAGSTNVPWVGTTTGSVMIDTYPKIAFLLVRESGGRMVQISGKSYLKHSRVAFNLGATVCGTCQTGPSNTWHPGCFDAYSTGFNGDRFNLGPTDEVDPWLGTWNSQGSYFDRGDPAVSGTFAIDRIQSLTSTQTAAFDAVKNRVVVRESELSTPGTFYTQAHLVVIGEAQSLRGDNQVSRGATFTWNGTSWSAAQTGTSVIGPVLTRWSGASTALGGNGNDDGRFMVACKVTGPTAGLWHYEYAVQNIDNNRGGASLRLPVCPTARVVNPGFRDIDADPLDEWTFHRSATEVAFLAAANNSLDWNTIYNFWFDSDAAPVAGTAVIDEARIGAGALSVSVAAQVPGRLGNEYLGDGCGTPAPQLYGNGMPSIPNPTYALRVQTAPLASGFLAFAFAGGNTALGNGCTQFVDGSQLAATSFFAADGAGLASFNLPIPPGLPPMDLWCQAAELVAGGPLFGQLALSNGMRARIGGTGCP